MKILSHHQKLYQTDLIKRVVNEDFVLPSEILPHSIYSRLNHVHLKKEFYFFQMRPMLHIFELEKTE
jgi:hypothetical protein